METGEGRTQPTGKWARLRNLDRRVWVAFGLLVVVLAGGVALGLPATGVWKASRAVARVNGKAITRGELDQYLKDLITQFGIKPERLQDEGFRKQFERQALERLVAERLILEEAATRLIVVPPGEEEKALGGPHGGQGPQAIDALAKRLGKDPGVVRAEIRRQMLISRVGAKITEGVQAGEQEVRDFYERHRNTLTTPPEARLRLIALDSQKEADEVAALLQQGGDFGKLARERSKGGAKGKDGEMGWVQVASLPKALAEAVTNLKGRGITPVVVAGGGFYILKVEETRGPRQLAFAEARERVGQALLEQKRQARLEEWLAEQRKKAKVEIFL